MHRVYNVCRLSCHDRICGFISDRSSDRTDRSAQMGCHIQPDSVSRCYPANQAPCKGQCDRSSDVSGTSVFDVGLDSPNNMCLTCTHKTLMGVDFLENSFSPHSFCCVVFYVEDIMDQNFMKEKKILPLVISMSLPMVVSMATNSLYNIVDSYFVAKISEDAMTAISLVKSIAFIWRVPKDK